MAHSPLSEPYVCQPRGTHSHTVIVLHGRGDNGPSFCNSLLESQASGGCTLVDNFPAFKWIFPTSEKRYSPVFQGELTEWFDIRSLRDPEQESATQLDGLSVSIKIVLDIARKETEQVPANRIILAGISQGFATAVIALLSGRQTFGALIGLSGWMPFLSHFEAISESLALAPDDASKGQTWKALTEEFFSTRLALPALPDPESHQAHSTLLTTPVLLAHASNDGVVSAELGANCQRVLRALQMNVIWKLYRRGGHWINEPEGIDDIVAFLRSAVEGAKNSPIDLQ